MPCRKFVGDHWHKYAPTLSAVLAITLCNILVSVSNYPYIFTPYSDDLHHSKTLFFYGISIANAAFRNISPLLHSLPCWGNCRNRDIYFYIIYSDVLDHFKTLFFCGIVIGYICINLTKSIQPNLTKSTQPNQHNLT